MDTYFNNLQFPGSRFWYFFTLAEFFLRGGLTTYAIGLYLVDSTPSVFESSPPTNIKLSTGIYLSPPEADLRFYAAGGLFLRLVHSIVRDADDQLEVTFGAEEAAPFGLELAAGAEYSPWLGFKFFFEYAPQLYYTADGEEFQQRTFPTALYPDGVVPGWWFPQYVALDYRNTVVGFRISW